MLPVAADRLDQLEHRQHRPARPDDVRELMRGVQRALEQHVLLLQPLALELLADAQPQLVGRARRLVHVVRRAEPQRLDGGVGRRERRHHDAGDRRVDALRLAQHVDAAHFRHPDVGDQDVDPLALAACSMPRGRPLSATSTSCPSRFSTIVSSSRIDRSSSTTSTRAGAPRPQRPDGQVGWTWVPASRFPLPGCPSCPPTGRPAPAVAVRIAHCASALPDPELATAQARILAAAAAPR